MNRSKNGIWHAHVLATANDVDGKTMGESIRTRRACSEYGLMSLVRV
jgi:hypothetical protein